MRLLICDSALNPVNRYIGQSIYRAAALTRSLSLVNLCTQSALGDTLSQQEYDQLLIIDGQNADTNVIARATARMQHASIWFFEDPYQLEKNVFVARDFQKVFTNELTVVGEYGRIGAFMPLAADPSACFFPVRSSWPIDICYIGSAWPNRCEILFALHDAFPNLKWHVRLLVNSAIKPTLREKGYLKRAEKLGWTVTEKRLPIRDVAAIANQSRITLSLPRSFSLSHSDNFVVSHSPAPRIFESGLAGSAQIVSSEISAAMQQLHYGKTIPSFRDADELCSRVEEMLTYDNLCRDIAKEAQSITRTHHTYQHRISDIVKALAESKATTRAISSNNNRTLIVAHGFTTQKSFGGVEVFVKRLLDEMRSEALITFPSIAESGRQYSYLVMDSNEKVVERLDTLPRQTFITDDEEIERWIESVIIKFGIATVFFAHLIYWPVSLVRRLNALGVVTIVKLNEFFYICPSFNLISASGVFCSRDTLGPIFCDSCLLEQFGSPPGTMELREKIFLDVLNSAQFLVAPSESTKAIYQKCLPNLDKNIAVKACPIQVPPEAERVRSNDELLKVLVPGSFYDHKGAREILEIIASGDDRIEFHICGIVAKKYLSQLLDLERKSGRVKVHGEYAPQDLPSIFSSCDVSLLLSIWPETYLITLTEVMLRGCVPIIFNIGAQSERVLDGENGFVFEVGDTDGVIKKLHELKRDRSQLERLRQGALATPYITAPEYVKFLEELTEKSKPSIGDILSSNIVLSNSQLGIQYAYVARKAKLRGAKKLRREFRRVRGQINGAIFKFRRRIFQSDL